MLYDIEVEIAKLDKVRGEIIKALKEAHDILYGNGYNLDSDQCEQVDSSISEALGKLE